MVLRAAKKRKVEKDDSDSDDNWTATKTTALAAWDDDKEKMEVDDEGSSEDEADNQQERILSKGTVMTYSRVSKVLTRKLKNDMIVAYAIVTDLGGGVSGFLPLSELVETNIARDVLSQRLSSQKNMSAPEPGMPDRRTKLFHLLPKGAGQAKSQILLSAKGATVCGSMGDNWAALPAHVADLLQHLYDRDRVAEATSTAGLHIGLLLEGTVAHRSKDGIVAELADPHNARHRNLVGVAIGTNAHVPTDNALPLASAKDSPASVPGTPQSLVSSSYDARRFRNSALKCRVLDFDLETGYIDIACCPTITQCNSATSSATSHNSHKTLKKKIGREILVQVILKKEKYAIVISRPFAGVLGYMPFRNAAEAAKVKSGDKITGLTEYVRIKPARPTPKSKGPATPKHWTNTGRRMQDDDEDEASSSPSTPRSVPGTPGSTDTHTSSRAGRHKSRNAPLNPEDTPQDPWLCAEPFAVFSFVPAKPKTDAVAVAVPATTTTTTTTKTTKATKTTTTPTTTTPAPAAVEEAAPTSSLAAIIASSQPVAPKKQEAIEVGFAFAEEEKGAQQAKKGEKRKRADLENELEVDEAERRRISDAEPHNVDDFERLVMASPHSSYVWCQYMAHYVSQREFEQSRLIAERALKKINYAETIELQNVWIAYLNLENRHGTPESLSNIFKRFVQHSDEPEQAYAALVQIGKATNNHALVDRTYNTMLKKFGFNNIKPWVELAQYHLSRGSQDEITKLQKRMLNNKSLSDKQQVDFLLKLGNMQYRQGSIDKGRTIFEGLTVKFPKRTDIWSVYLDMEQVVLPRLEDMTRIRLVYDRITSMPLSSKKMQFFMTKYLTFEKNHGTAGRVEYVKKRAMDFVNAKLGEAEEE